MDINESFNQNNKVNIDTSGGRRSIISPKVYQDIYHQITGKTEKISKSYKNNLLIDFEEIKQLNIKVLQLADIHHVIGKNESIVIYYDNDRKEEFTSFERFEKYNSSKNKATLNLILKYNFLIQLPELPNPQAYVLTIKLNSRLAMIETLEREAPAFIPYGIFAFMHRNSAEISIEYIDYVIARGFIETFDEWVNGCHSIAINKYLNFFQSSSKYLPIILQLIIGTITVYSFLLFIETLPDIFSQSWGRFFVISFVSFFFIIKAASLVGSFIEKYIDSFYQDSYLRLTRGDEKLIERSKARKRGIAIRIIFQVCFTIILGAIGSKLANYI